MMMNILALFLVLSSIGVGVFSPNPEKHKNSREEDVIVKEAHRLVFMEYEREIEPKKEYQRLEANHKPITESSPSASASASPSSAQAQTQTPLEYEQRGLSSVSSLVGNANEKMREACSVLPNLGHGISGEALSGACEKVRQKADEGLDIAKELASYKVHLIEKGAKGAKTAAVETGRKVEEGYEKAKEKTHDFKEAFKDAKDSATESIKRIPQRVAEKAEWEKEAIIGAKDKILEKTHDAKESVAESFKKIPQRVAEKTQWEKEAVGDAKEKILEKTHDLSEGIGAAKESLKEKTQDLSEGIGDVKDKTMRFIPQSLSRGKWKVLDKAYDMKDAAEETATDASEKLGGTIGKVKEVSEETAMKAKEMVSDKAHSLKESAAGAKEAVSEKTHDFKEAIAETAADTPKKVSEGFSKAKETVMKRMPETIADKAHEFKEAIEETAAETPRKVSEGFQKAKETVMSRMPESIGKASEQVSEKSHEFKEDIKETAGMAAPHEEMPEGLFSKSKEKVLDKAQELEASSKETIETATERTKRFKEIFKDTFHQLETALKDDRTKQVKATHFLGEGSRNFTLLFTKSFLSVYHASDESVNWFVGVVRLIGFATAYGSCVWVTFVSSHVLSGALPRQQYGMLQSKIYPVYFRVMAYALGFSLLGHLFTKHHDKSSPSEKSHGYDLMASIGLILVNMLVLEPRATKAMLDIMKQEKEEGRGTTVVEPSSAGGSRIVGEVEVEGSERQAEGEVREEDRTQHQAHLEKLNKRLKRLNTFSAFCNILTLMVLTSHLAILSQCLYVSC